MALSRVDELVASKIPAGPLSLVMGKYQDTSPESVRIVGDSIRQKLSGVVVVLFAVNMDQSKIVAMADKKAVELGVNCGKLVKKIAGELGGGGGGRPDMAQAGIRDIQGIERVMSKVPEMIVSMTGENN